MATKNIMVPFDTEIDEDILALMPKWGRGAWVRRKLIDLLSQDLQRNDEYIEKLVLKHIERAQALGADSEIPNLSDILKTFKEELLLKMQEIANESVRDGVIPLSELKYLIDSYLSERKVDPDEEIWEVD